MLGVVTSFDDARGDGLVVGDDGVSYYVHCIEIADGSRTIGEGQRVCFVVRPGLLGRDEASDVQSLSDAAKRT